MASVPSQRSSSPEPSSLKLTCVRKLQDCCCQRMNACVAYSAACAGEQGLPNVRKSLPCHCRRLFHWNQSTEGSSKDSPNPCALPRMQQHSQHTELVSASSAIDSHRQPSSHAFNCLPTNNAKHKHAAALKTRRQTVGTPMLETEPVTWKLFCSTYLEESSARKTLLY